MNRSIRLKKSRFIRKIYFLNKGCFRKTRILIYHTIIILYIIIKNISKIRLVLKMNSSFFGGLDRVGFEPTKAEANSVTNCPL